MITRKKKGSPQRQPDPVSRATDDVDVVKTKSLPPCGIPRYARAHGRQLTPFELRQLMWQGTKKQ